LGAITGASVSSTVESVAVSTLWVSLGASAVVVSTIYESLGAITGASVSSTVESVAVSALWESLGASAVVVSTI